MPSLEAEIARRYPLICRDVAGLAAEHELAEFHHIGLVRDLQRGLRDHLSHARMVGNGQDHVHIERFMLDLDQSAIDTRDILPWGKAR
ncbi:hypothetical protein JQ617_31450 [Bradyrhizobium sp. KB893862 SZCCT0404]|nr:hypothetical protein [Bradyrhizobium sp. KB893862 SZCCT0404]